MRFSYQTVDSVIHRNVQLAPELKERLEYLHKRSQANMEYLDAHYGELLSRYPDEWIAIRDQTVIAQSRDSFREVFEKLDELGIDRSDVLVWFLWSEPANLIL